MECSPTSLKELKTIPLNPYNTFVNELANRVERLQEQSTAIVHLDCTKVEFVEDGGIQFTVLLLAKLAKKPTKESSGATI